MLWAKIAIVIGDFIIADRETRVVADQVTAFGRTDAVIHNAGIYTTLDARGPCDQAGGKYACAVHPYRDERTSWASGLPEQQPASRLRGFAGRLDWTERAWNPAKAYAESKLHVAALAAALARRWSAVVSNAVDPGWVHTRMGGSSAPVDLDTG